MPINSSTCNLALIKNTANKINQVKNEIKNLQIKSTSEIKAQHYYDMPLTVAEQNLYVEDILRQCQIKDKNYQWLANLISMQESALQTLNDTVESATSLSVQAYNAYGSTVIDMESNNKHLLMQIESVLSNSFFGMNIWNGSHTNETPCTNNSIVDGKAGSNFYLGDDFGLKLYIDGNEAEYGDRANYECCQKLISAIQQMRDIKDPTLDSSKKILEGVSKLLHEAQQGFLDLLQKVGNVGQKCQNALENNQTTLENLSDLYVNALNGMSPIDTPMSIMDMNMAQNKLQYMLQSVVALVKEMDIFKYI